METSLYRMTAEPVFLAYLRKGGTMGQNNRRFLRDVATSLCAGLALAVLPVETSCAQERAPASRQDFQRIDSYKCAIATAFGEARGKGVVEAAVVVNGLVESAQEAGISICAASRARYKPGKGSSHDIVTAVDNVLFHGASLVPTEFKDATEFRAPSVPRLHSRKLKYIGQIDPRGNPHGNVFYKARL
jgi:hypothetical protein